MCNSATNDWTLPAPDTHRHTTTHHLNTTTAILTHTQTHDHSPSQHHHSHSHTHTDTRPLTISTPPQPFTHTHTDTRPLTITTPPQPFTHTHTHTHRHTTTHHHNNTTAVDRVLTNLAQRNSLSFIDPLNTITKSKPDVMNHLSSHFGTCLVHQNPADHYQQFT